MPSKKLFDNWNIIEDKKVGRCIGYIKTYLEGEHVHYDIYEQRVRVLQSPNNLGLYATATSKDTYYLKNNKLVENKKQKYLPIYCGKNLSRALDYFIKIVENDKKMKENEVYKIFSRN